MKFSTLIALLFLGITMPGFSQLGIDDAVQKNFSDALSNVTLKNYDGTAVNLAEYADHELNIFIFLGHECPICQKYGHKLRTLDQRFRKDNIQIYGLVPLADVSLNTLETYVKQYEFKFPVLHDKQLIMADLLGAKVTPHVFVINNDGDLLYQGMIDNWFYALGKYRKVITENYLEDAVDSHLAMQPIETKRTEPIGCFISTRSLNNEDQ